jgi:hypothetical protein
MRELPGAVLSALARSHMAGFLAIGGAAGEKKK